MLALSAVLASCGSQAPPTAITVDRYSELQHAPKLVARQFRVSCRVVDAAGNTTVFPVVLVNAGRSVEVKPTNSKEYVYPTAFDLPKIGIPGKSNAVPADFPVTPTTPTAFELREIGDRAKLTAHTRGAFVELSGSYVNETASLGSRSAGEAVSPIFDSKRRICFTNNKVELPQFKRIESLIYVCGLPGKEHKVHLSEQNCDLCITCEVAR